MNRIAQLGAMRDVMDAVMAEHSLSLSLRGASCRCGRLRATRNHDEIAEHFLVVAETTMHSLGYELAERKVVLYAS